MITVPMALVSAVTGQVTSLGTLHIINDGTSTDPKIGHYTVEQFAKNGRIVKRARLENWRRQARPPMALLAAALRVLGHDVGDDRED